MYNRYIPNGNRHTRIPEAERPPRQSPRPERQQSGHASPQGSSAVPPPRNGEKKPSAPPPPPFAPNPGQKRNPGLAGILKRFHLEDLDSGDILLILILLFLFRDGEDIELLITLALILLLGPTEKQSADRQGTVGT